MKRQFFLLLVAIGFVSSSFAQEYFGQNKVQYDQFQFSICKTPHFSIYYYPEEADAVKMIAQMAEIWYDRYSKIFNYQFNSPNPIILYASPEHFAQTDIIPGILGEGIGGVTESDKDRVIIPLSADWRDNNHVLGHELVHAFQYRVLQHGDSTNIRDVQNLPLWMVEGLAEYLSLGPNDPNTAMWLRDAIVNDNFPTLKKITNDYRYFPYRWGEAFWAYVAGTYGEQVIPKLFTGTARDGYETAIKKVLGLSMKDFNEQWEQQNQIAYSGYVNEQLPGVSVGTRMFEEKKAVASEEFAPAISPNGKYVVFLSAKNPLTLDLYLADAHTKKIIGKLKTERSDAHGNALRLIESAATWSPDSRSVAFFSYEDGKHYLRIQEAESDKNKQKILLTDYQSVLNPSWSPDGKKIAFVGVNQGSGDLYVYDLKKKTFTRLTNDGYADLQPSWAPDSKSIVFLTDRFSGTDFSKYYFGTFDVAKIQLANNSISKIPLFKGVNHINPQYNRDSMLYFIASPDGVNNIYRYNPKTKTVERVTKEKTAAAGITDLSPALSIASRTGDLIYSVFRKGGYQLFAIRSKEIKTIPADTAKARNDISAGKLPPLESKDSTVATYIAARNNSAMNDSLFHKAFYKPKLSLSNISNAGIGIGVGPYGAGLGGGVTAIFSDMLDEHIVYGALSASGSIQDIGGVVGYLNQKHRFSWGATISHTPYGYSSFSAFYDTIRIDGELTYDYNLDQYILREFDDALTGIVYYPLSRVYRVEGGLGLTFVNFSYQDQRARYLIDAFGNPTYQIDQQNFKLPAPKGYQYGTVSLAFVADNSKFGFTSPLDGYRYRIETDGIMGPFKFGTLLTDFRAYKYVKPVSFAARVMHYGRYFGDANDSTSISPITIGADFLVRGYNAYSFDYAEVPANGNGSTPEVDRLYGSKIGVVNLEVRIPVTGPREMAPIKSLAFPSTFQIFFDGGVAWSQSAPSLKFTTDYNELTTNPSRYPVFSTGVSLRVNVLGAFVLEGYYAIPFQRPLRDPFNHSSFAEANHISKGVFGLLLYPGW